MKVTSLAGSGLGTAQTGSQAIGQDRKEAAKQAYLGQSGKTVTPSENNAESLQTAERNVRKIQMKTNASPDRFMNETQEETQEITEPVESEVTRPISPQFAELARRQRALQVKESEIAAREKSLAEKASSPQGIELEKIKANPLGVLRDAGVTYEQLTEAILADQSGVNPQVQALQDKIEALEKGFETKFTERDTQAEQQVLGEMRKEADQLVAQGDDFEMIRGTKSQGKVIDLIHKTWKATGEVLDVHQAATLIEQEIEKDALRFTSFKKVQGKLNPPQEVVAPQQNKLRTLTNRQAASTPTSAKARAIAAFRGTLKE